jgi:hypothetical protein
MARPAWIDHKEAQMQPNSRASLGADTSARKHARSRSRSRLAALLSAALLGTLALPAAQAADTPSAATAAALARFDGAWATKLGVSLIKAYSGHLLLTGRDTGSSWAAHCVLRSGNAVCRGMGHTNDGQGFAFESTMSMSGERLIDDWRALFFDDNELKGKDALVRLVTPQ